VHLHGGSIEARSEGVGMGSELIVRLPVITPVNNVAQPAPPRSLHTARRVLICDDNRDSADSLGELVEISGHSLRVVYDAVQAISTAGLWRPEVVLLDIGLLNMNGYEAAQRIREMLADSEPLLIAITGWGQEKDRRRRVRPASLITS
jgi:CheY-like chemotaxis protein